MRKKIYDEEDKIREIREQKEHLLSTEETVDENKKDPYVYQYRSLENFWQIIRSDCFWATNARFSNDYKEQQLGKQKMCEIVYEANEDEQAELQGDCYIVCFCDDDDKLSQWRGYAEEGVSIGFDFRNIRPFYIERKEQVSLCVYNSCYKVIYIDEDTDKMELIDRFKLSVTKDKNNLMHLKKKAFDVIPYVKHNGFKEEAESRLMFSDNEADLSQCIRYRDSNGIKIPYIVVKAGRDVKNSKCIIRLQVKESQKGDLKRKLQVELKNRKIQNVQIINCFDLDGKEADDKLCYGCTVRHGFVLNDVQQKRQCCIYHKSSEERFYGNAANEIYLSDAENQEEVCNFLHIFINKNEEYKGFKIWCEGHLPIRRITVGSLKGQETVIESIKHYCKQRYWLRSVEVLGSKIPYRSKLI